MTPDDRDDLHQAAVGLVTFGFTAGYSVTLEWWGMVFVGVVGAVAVGWWVDRIAGRALARHRRLRTKVAELSAAWREQNKRAK